MKIKDKKLARTLTVFAKAMQERLAEKEEEGYEGWDDQDMWVPILSKLLQDAGRILDADHEETKDLCIDIANRAMMLWNISMEK